MLIRGAGGGEGGGELMRGEGGGELIRGAAGRLISPRSAPFPRAIPGAMPGCIIERGGPEMRPVGTRSATIPLLCTCCETLDMLERPRGTPSPAELLRIMILLPG